MLTSSGMQVKANDVVVDIYVVMSAIPNINLASMNNLCNANIKWHASKGK